MAMPAGALSELQVANEMLPNSPEVHFHLARAYARDGQPEKASQERETFARLNAIAEHQRSTRGSQAYGASHEQESDLSLPPVQLAFDVLAPVTALRKQKSIVTEIVHI